MQRARLFVYVVGLGWVLSMFPWKRLQKEFQRQLTYPAFRDWI